MIYKAPFIFCENEHGTGDVCFPDVGSTVSEDDLKQLIITQHTVGSIRRLAKQQGWGRVNGGDYCPHCMESM
jgi:hypothetical protein